MKKTMLFAALTAAVMLSACGNAADSSSEAPAETSAAETTAAAGEETAAPETEAPAETSPAETEAPAETSASETTAAAETTTGAQTAASENDFLSGLNEQMAKFNENVGNISVDSFSVDFSYAEVPDAGFETADGSTENDTDTSADPETSSGELVTVGDDDHGYVDVPSDWKMITAPDKGKWDIIRYYDEGENNVISLQRYETTLAQMAADKIYDLIDESPLTEITNSFHTDVQGMSTYRIDAKILESGHYLFVWVMQDESGDARYLSAESDSEDILDIASTYRIAK